MQGPIASSDVSFSKPPDLLNRDEEWRRLLDRFRTPGPELVLVVGRRRAGKSFLLTRFARAVGGVYYQASNRTGREQLAELSRVVGEHFHDPALRSVAFGSWEDLFDYLVARAGGKPLAFVLDEFPYLADADLALPSVIQRIWDHKLPGTRLKLVLSGSHITAMRRLTDPDRPLYGRRTARFYVSPFDYFHAAAFVPRYSARDRLRAYGIFGGLPGHLALLDPGASLSRNAASLLLDPSSRLYDEAVHVFDAFLRDAGVHYAIVEAIAAGERNWSRISRRVGKQTSSLARPMEWLMEMGVVARTAPVTQLPRPSPKRVLYSIRDPYLLFWHRFVSDLRARGVPELVPPRRLWRKVVAPRLDTYMGETFEEACRTFVARSRHPRLPFEPLRVGSWWSSDGTAEVDVVALSGEGDLLLGECRWGRLRERDFERLRARALRIQRELSEPVTRATFALFSAGGIRSRRLRAKVESGEVLYFSLDDLYRWEG